jgi:hypothetical protein
MTAPHIINPAGLLDQALGDASPDLMRHLRSTVVNALLSADADAVCGAEYGTASPQRVNSRSGYWHRDLDTRADTIDVAIPKLRSGSYFPEWLLERRKRAEAVLVSVVATCYLLGVSTRRMDKLVQSLGITSLSRSQVSRMATDLDAQVAAFRTRPLGGSGPFTFVAADALTMKVREQGRVVNAVVLVATGVNADGHREVLGVKVATSETRQAWNTFFADLVAHGLTGTLLVTSDVHAGLVDAIAANLPGASWQLCRTHWSRKETTFRLKIRALLVWYDGPRASGHTHRIAVRCAVPVSERAAATAYASSGGRLLGHGGVRAVARAAGVSEATVRAGAAKLSQDADPALEGRTRRRGGGRKSAEDLDVGLVPALLALVEPDERGDPMSPLRWTTKSLRHLAAELARQGHPVSAPRRSNAPRLPDKQNRRSGRSRHFNADRPKSCARATRIWCARKCGRIWSCITA